MFLAGDDISDNAVCTTEECVRASANLLNWMDSRFDPCDDFESFACGNYFLRKPGEDALLSLDHLDEHKKEMITLLINDPIRESDNPSVRTLKTAYANCINRNETNEIYEARALLNFHEKWPILQTAFRPRNMTQEDGNPRIIKLLNNPFFTQSLFNIQLRPRTNYVSTIHHIELENHFSIYFFNFRQQSRPAD